MSKAFTRESDDVPDLPITARQPSNLPPGAKNYLTAKGARQLRDELERLTQEERPRLAAAEASSDRRAQLQLLDQRVAHLQQSLHSAIVVETPPKPWDQVRFGATVTVREADGSESRYRIVGADEADVDRDWVSCYSPLARALLNARIGKRVRFRAPAGEQELEIVGIEYD